MGETDDHKAVKHLLATKMKEWYAVAVEEYPDAGNEDDVIAVVNGKKILFEVIWHPTESNFNRDLSIIALSPARIKIAAVNPKFFQDKDTFAQIRRRYEKARVEMLAQGVSCSPFFDGSRLLDDSTYVGRLHDFIQKALGRKDAISLIFDPTSAELLGRFKYQGSDLFRKFGRVEVWNRSEEAIEDLLAYVRVLEGPRKPIAARLHAANQREDPGDQTPLKKMPPGDRIIFDVVFAPLPSTFSNVNSNVVTSTSGTRNTGLFPKSPAGTQSAVFTGTGPEIVGPGAPGPYTSFRGQLRVKVDPRDAIQKGCYIAHNDALRHPRDFPQYHLGPGNYLVEVEVFGSQGITSSKKYRIISAENPEDFSMAEVSETA